MTRQPTATELQELGLREETFSIIPGAHENPFLETEATHTAEGIYAERDGKDVSKEYNAWLEQLPRKRRYTTDWTTA